MTESTRTHAVRSTLPIFWGYLAAGVAFGLLLQKLGYATIHSTGAAVFVYAGSAQLVMLRLLQDHETLLSIFFAIFILNVRHFFYGLAMYHRYKKIPWSYRWYLIFGLTDETFALLSNSRLDLDSTRDGEYLFWVTFINQLYWVAACSLGAWLGSLITCAL